MARSRSIEDTTARLCAAREAAHKEGVPIVLQCPLRYFLPLAR